MTNVGSAIPDETKLILDSLYMALQLCAHWHAAMCFAILRAYAQIPLLILALLLLHTLWAAPKEATLIVAASLAPVQRKYRL